MAERGGEEQLNDPMARAKELRKRAVIEYFQEEGFTVRTFPDTFAIGRKSEKVQEDPLQVGDIEVGNIHFSAGHKLIFEKRADGWYIVNNGSQTLKIGLVDAQQEPKVDLLEKGGKYLIQPGQFGVQVGFVRDITKTYFMACYPLGDILIFGMKRELQVKFPNEPIKNEPNQSE